MPAAERAGHGVDHGQRRVELHARLPQHRGDFGRRNGSLPVPTTRLVHARVRRPRPPAPTAGCNSQKPPATKSAEQHRRREREASRAATRRLPRNSRQRQFERGCAGAHRARVFRRGNGWQSAQVARCVRDFRRQVVRLAADVQSRVPAISPWRSFDVLRGLRGHRSSRSRLRARNSRVSTAGWVSPSCAAISAVVNPPNTCSTSGSRYSSGSCMMARRRSSSPASPSRGQRRIAERLDRRRRPPWAGACARTAAHVRGARW